MKTYTLQQIAKENNIKIPTLERRRYALKLEPIGQSKNSKAKLYNESQARKLINYEKQEPIKIPEIIRITETYYIYPSKMNYDTATL